MDSEAAAIEERLARLERGMAGIIARLDAMTTVGEVRASGHPPRITPVQPEPGRRSRPYGAQFASKSAEWWLARGGAALTCLAVILLYQYAVERNWITPVVRVLMGSAVGLGLMVSGFRIVKPAHGHDAAGLREALMGAGLAAWYVTAYAAAVFYHLVPMSGARLVFLALSIAGIWLALSEKRALLALLAVGAGFSAPSLLEPVNPSIPSLAVYLAALAALGLVVYLMRGWQSVLWLTFMSFWWSVSESTALVAFASQDSFPRITGPVDVARAAMTLLIIAAAMAMTRVPLLRRQLIALGSDLYTEPRRSAAAADRLASIAGRVARFTRYPAAADSATVWLVTLCTPPLAVLLLSWTWRSADSSAWGLAMIACAAVAHRLAASGRADDDELRHVEASAVVLWSMSGLLWIADGSWSARVSPGAIAVVLLSLHAFAAIHVLRDSRLVAPRKLALMSAAGLLLAVLASETMFPRARISYDPAWTIGEIFATTLAAWIWSTFRRQGNEALFAKAFGLGAYVALLLIDARILGLLWPPLITASYAIAGAALLMFANRSFDPRSVRRLGGVTLVVVVGRLILIDLARVEAIWRVLLFLVCGGLFLFTSYRLQSARVDPSAGPAA